MPVKEKKQNRASKINKERAARAEKALSDYEDSAAQNVIDLLADLRHYCDREGLDIYESLDTSYVHYLEERQFIKRRK